MLRAVSSIYIESQAFELFAKSRKDVFKLFRTTSTASQSQQTVLTNAAAAPAAAAPQRSPPPPPPPPPLPPPPPPPRRAWTVAAAALALSASIGGVYYYRKLNEQEKGPPAESEAPLPSGAAAARSIPAHASELPERVQYLLVGGGTASFAAMRALRSHDPHAQVLIVGEEVSLPYMRPPLSKELWREPAAALAALAAGADGVSFRQWDGRRRPLAYEPAAFYAPPRRLDAGAGLARGWRVLRLRPEEGQADLVSLEGEPHTVQFEQCLVATGSRPRRLEALRPARAAGRAFALRNVHDAAALAAALDRLHSDAVVAVVGGGLLGSEVSWWLRARGLAVALLVRGAAPLRRLLPGYLAGDAARALRDHGLTLLTHAEVVGSEVSGEGVELVLSDGRRVPCALVVECVGSVANDELAAASGLERDPRRGGLLVAADLRARGRVFAAGDVASVHAPGHGRHRLEHHEHALRTARVAAHNMAARTPPRTHRPHAMFWTDLGPRLAFEAIGTVDSSLRTVAVFCDTAVTGAESPRAAAASAADHHSAVTATPTETSTPLTEPTPPLAESTPPSGAAAAVGAGDAAVADKQFERGVVFYLRDERVVGVLLWNLFNRIHIARQVLEQGHFEDLVEVAKLFTLHEDD